MIASNDTIKRFGGKKNPPKQVKNLKYIPTDYEENELIYEVNEDVEVDAGLYNEVERQDASLNYTKNMLYDEANEVSMYDEAELQDKASEYSQNIPIYNMEEEFEVDAGLYDETEMQAVALRHTENMLYNNTEVNGADLYDEVESKDWASEYTELHLSCSDVESKDACSPIRHNFDAKLCTEEVTVYKYALDIMERESFCYLDSPEVSNNISRYNGMYWEVLNDKQLKAIVYQYISERDKYANNSIEFLCKNISTYIKYEVRDQYFKGKKFTDADFRKIQNRVVFRNLVYDVQTGEKLEFDKNLPYYFAVDAEYIEEDEDTPFYEKLKADATEEDKDSMNMFDCMIAYLIIPNRSGKCYFVLANAKDSGKSLLGQFISNLYVGNRTQSIDPEHLGDRFAFSNVGEKVLLSCLEMNTARLKKNTVAQIKRITGESRIRSEAKYQNEQTIMVRFKLMLATNGGILLPEGVEDNAFYRRTIVIPFIKSTPLDSLISDMDKKLQKEKNAILSNAVRKFKTYISKDGGIVFPESVLSLSMKEKWIGGKCVDDEFIKLAFSYTGDSKDRIAIKELEYVYQSYIEHQRMLIGDVIVSDRKILIHKICSTYAGVEKKKSRVKNTLFLHIEGSTEALRRIKWDRSEISSWGVY